jgi:hypothetical protein
MKLVKYRQPLLAACCLGVLGLFAGCYQIGISFEPSATEVSSIKQEDLSGAPITPVSSQTTQLLSYDSTKGNKNIGVGSLRLSNQTKQPVRLALLSRREQPKQNPTTSNMENLPAHWDFAPQEGSEKGLVLSLPDGKLLLKKGDVVVAFAQDGSRRYWGPYVVGETPFPAWNSQKKEWWLILNK